ncbi:MAG: hypothetical protein IMF12_05215, partial [Proteobacteria bacterium]|nr:hypothetical protein [Pseudomonadota bacterium]
MLIINEIQKLLKIMFLTKIKIYKYRLFENLEINLEKSSYFLNVFSVASMNGGGKSTFLQFVFTMLHCFMDDDKKQYIRNLLENEDLEEGNLARFELSVDGKDYFLEFLVSSVEFNKKYLDIFGSIEGIKIFVKNTVQQTITSLKQQIKDNNEFTPHMINELFSLKKKYKHIESITTLCDKVKKSGKVEDYKLIIDMHEETKNGLDKLENLLRRENLLYITHLNNDMV